MYKVYDENNVKVNVTEKQLEESLNQSGLQLPLEIIGAMGESLDPKFAPRLQEALYHDKQRNRITAIYGLLSLLNKDHIDKLREKERNIPIEDLSKQISEKAILQAALIRLEYGAEGAMHAFLSEETIPQIKSLLIYNYSSSNMQLNKKDIEFLVTALELYVCKNELWIQNMKKNDYEEDVIACLEALSRVSETSSILSHLENDLYNKLISYCSELLQVKIDPYAKELIVTFARALPPELAYTMLEPIMDGRARGDIRKELKFTIEILQKREQEME